MGLKFYQLEFTDTDLRSIEDYAKTLYKGRRFDDVSGAWTEAVLVELKKRGMLTLQEDVYFSNGVLK